MMFCKTLFILSGVIGSALAITLQSEPIVANGTNHVQLANYNYTSGIFNAEIFVHDDNYTKEVFLYYTNSNGESTPLSGVNAERGDSIDDHDGWDLYTISNPILQKEGLSKLLNIIAFSQINDDLFIQNLDIEVKHVTGDTTETSTVRPAPAITPSGFYDDIDQWLDSKDVDSQAAKSKTRIFNNIGINGSVPGLVVAAQSFKEPDYGFHWIRDAGLTYDFILQLYKSLPNRDSKFARDYEDYFLQFIKASIDEQKDQSSITGLGDPKFYLNNNTAYQGLWGRPQNDGPSIRAYVLIEFVKEYIAKGGDKDYIIDLSWETPIKVDLNYIVTNWTENTYDAWEEVNSDNFFNKMVARKALNIGSEFSSKYLKDFAYYKKLTETNDELNSTIGNFVNQLREYIIVNYGPVIHRKSSRKDLSTLLGINHGYLNDGIFSPTHDYVVRSVYEIGTSFLDVFGICNITQDDSGLPLAPATGRYPEDVYNGVNTSFGNPWYLSTAAFAEYFYTVAKDFQIQKTITITNLTQPFWEYYAPTVEAKAGTSITESSEEFEQLINALTGWGDAYIRTIKHFSGEDGHLSEQYDRETGEPRGANDLTWSYVSVLTAAFKRAELKGDDDYVRNLAQLE